MFKRPILKRHFFVSNFCHLITQCSSYDRTHNLYGFFSSKFFPDQGQHKDKVSLLQMINDKYIITLMYAPTEPNMKKRVQVQLKNFQGLDEAGIDGGGIFREFMAELIKTAFDPNRGFFKCTNDKLLYPSPQASLLVEDYESHYYFLGRILGKVCVKSSEFLWINILLLNNYLII